MTRDVCERVRERERESAGEDVERSAHLRLHPYDESVRRRRSRSAAGDSYAEWTHAIVPHDCFARLTRA